MSRLTQSGLALSLLIGEQCLLQDITLGKPTYGPDGTLTDPTVEDLEAFKLLEDNSYLPYHYNEITAIEDK